MKRGLAWAAAAVAALVAAAWLLGRASPVPVQLARAERGRVEETVSATRSGTLKAKVRVVLGAQAAGRVEALMHREHDRVARGEPLCLLEASELDARLAQAEHALADAERHWHRQKELFERGVVPREAFDQAGTRRDLERAAVDLARAQRAKAVLQAPFDGLVADTFVEPGQWVVPGEAVCEFLDDREYHVEAEVDEIDSARLRVGQGVHLTVDALSGTRFEGVLTSVSPLVSTEQEKNRTVRIKVAWTGDRSRVRPGMSVGVEVVVGAADGVLCVPSPAVMDHAGRRLVYTVLDGRLEEREVSVGVGNWETVEILRGLSEGEPVVLSLAVPGLVPGSRVSSGEGP